MSEAKSDRIKRLEDEVAKLRKYIDTIAGQATHNFQEMDSRVKKLEDRDGI